MTRDELDALRVIAVSQRQCQSRRGGKGCSDARHHANPHAVRPAGFEFFSGAGEDGRISALQPYDAFSRKREFDEKRVDILLPAGAAMALLADKDAPRLAPGEFEHRSGDEPVVEDHVGSLQFADRLQGQELGVARPCADNHHFALRPLPFARGDVPGKFFELRKTLVLLALADEGDIRKPLPEVAPRRPRRRDDGKLLPKRLGRRTPSREGLRQDGFDAAADRLAEHGRTAVGGDRHDNRRAVDDGAELEVAIGGLVDHVDERATAARSSREARCLLAVCLGDGNCGAVEIGRIPGAENEVDHIAVGGNESGEFRRRIGAIDADLGAGGGKKLGLPGNRVALAGDDGKPSRKVEEDRELGQRREAGGTGLDGRDVTGHRAGSRVERAAEGAAFKGPVRAWKSAPFAVFATCFARIRKAPNRSSLRRRLA